MDNMIRILDSEIATVSGFPPAILDLPGDTPTVRMLNRMLIIEERSIAVRTKGRRKIRFK
uniref:Uncharacterized protein n=1 Tax=viral metagenome TaxID=1070528 RepID=A0A6C0KE85_9ZZZZ